MPGYKDTEARAAYKRAYNKRYYERKRDELIAAAVERKRANPEQACAASKKWRAENKAVDAATRARRRAEKDCRTPSWADMTAIRAMYAEAAALGMEVDHIIPLRGALVSGLHVESNLQMLTREANIKKGNRFAVGGA